MIKKITIIDYGIGNVQSIMNALSRFDITSILSSDKQEILNSDAIILPGVGAFRRAMERLKEKNLDSVINEFALTGKPFLGICLGMQLLFDQSDEFGITPGLGLIHGKVEKFSTDLKAKLPHIGWCTLNDYSSSFEKTIFSTINSEDKFYFIHSYICKPNEDKYILSTTEYGGIQFCSAVKKDNIIGCQFHPEKSGESGLKVIKEFTNFVNKF